MIEVVITKEQLEKALAAVNRASKNGYTESLAILELASVGRCLDDNVMEYGGAVVLRSHLTDLSQHWGRMSDRLMEYEEAEKEKGS